MTFDNLLQEVLREHAQRKVVGSEKLDNAGFLIHELDLEVNNIGRTQKQGFQRKDQKSWDQELQVQI